MKKMTKKILFYYLFMILITGCTKYIEPTDTWGKTCLYSARAIQKACEEERRDEINACERRVNKTLTIRKDQVNDKITQKQVTANEGMAILVLESFNKENCYDLIRHCSAQYRERFLICGGRIE